MTDAITDRRSGPAEPAAPAGQVYAAVQQEISAKDFRRRVLAEHIRALADQVERGDVPYDQAAVVLFNHDDRAVQVQHAGMKRSSQAFWTENDMLAAMQRAITRWSLPLE